MYNFVCTSAFACACTANCKSEGQIKGKLSYVKNRQHALQKMLYGIAVLDSQNLNQCLNCIHKWSAE